MNFRRLMKKTLQPACVGAPGAHLWLAGLALALQLGSGHADTPAAAAAEPPGASAVVLKIGDRSWTAGAYRRWAAAVNQAEGHPSADLDDEALARTAQTLLLADQARAGGLDRDPQVAEQIRLAVDKVLAAAERDRLFGSAPVSDGDIARRLAERPGAYDEFSLSHIFIASGAKSAGPHPRSDRQALAEARRLRALWARGASFEELARKHSDDSASARQGGHLPALLGQYLSPAFAPAVIDLSEGEVSAPIRGSEGYHLILLDGRKRASLESRRAFMAALMRDEAVDQRIAELLRAHPPQIDRAALAAAPAP